MTHKNHIFIFIGILLSSCVNEDPQKEDVPELITKATLTFTPATGTPIGVTATDPDGEGVQDIATDGPIILAKATNYVLTIKLINGLANPGDEGYDVSKEVEEEGDEHQFFFTATSGAFETVDTYKGGANSKDANGLPLGLTTTWVTSNVATSGEFRVILKHQPGLKSSTSTSNDGETDLDVTFVLSVQ
jgi:hypothetical protein